MGAFPGKVWSFFKKKKTYFLQPVIHPSKPGQRFQNPRISPKTFSLTTSRGCGRRCWQLQLKSAEWFYSFIFTLPQHHQGKPTWSLSYDAWADLLSSQSINQPALLTHDGTDRAEAYSSSLSNCLTHSLLGTEKTAVHLKSHVSGKYFGWRRSEKMMNNNKKKKT